MNIFNQFLPYSKELNAEYHERSFILDLHLILFYAKTIIAEKFLRTILKVLDTFLLETFCSHLNFAKYYNPTPSP